MISFSNTHKFTKDNGITVIPCTEFNKQLLLGIRIYITKAEVPSLGT